MLKSGDIPVSTVAEQFRVARSTLYRNVAVGASHDWLVSSIHVSIAISDELAM
jgi:Helix-turn-helix domain of resolvase